MIDRDLHGRYRVLAEIGRGGMGEVYLAEHIQRNRLEALKVLKPAVADEFAGRFRREARAMNRLRHPNIVSVYDFGQLADGRFYLAMEYAEGPSVREVLRELRRFDIDRALPLLIQMADAMDHAHLQGVIHRDLKPSNMIMGKVKGDADLLKILDFGVAKIIAADEHADLVKTGKIILGTPAYMAPELIAGVGDDPRSDIYSLGCIAFELLAGRPPFTGRPVEICQSHVALPAPRLSAAVGEQMPEALESLVASCLAKTPSSRPATGGDLALALHGVLRTRRGRRRLKFPSTLKMQITPIGREPSEEGKTVIALASDIAFAVGDSGELEGSLFEFRLGLRQLAEVVADQGCTDARLVIALAEVNRVDSDVSRVAADLAELRRERSRVEQIYREREAALRFSHGELTFARQHGNYTDDETEQLTEAVGTLDVELHEQQIEALDRHHTIDDREIELVARASHIDEERERVYAKLDVVLSRVVPRFIDSEAVATLRAYVDAVRPERRRLPGVATQSVADPSR